MILAALAHHNCNVACTRVCFMKQLYFLLHYLISSITTYPWCEKFCATGAAMAALS
jgi:hypothetical protein